MSRNHIAKVGTMRTKERALSRRRLLKMGGSAALAASVAPGIIIPGRAKAQQKMLKILQWKHFVPSYDEWFNGTYVKEWGERNDTQVIVDNVGFCRPPRPRKGRGRGTARTRSGTVHYPAGRARRSGH